MGNSNDSDPFCDTITEEQIKWDFVCADQGDQIKSCSSLNPQTLDMALLSASIVIGGTILFLNLVILWTARKKQCRTPINGLVYGLCVEDLLTALVIIPLFIASFKSNLIFLGPLCNLYGFSVVFMSMASGSTVCLISILQTYAYIRPLAFRCHIRTYTVRISSIVRYLLMFLFVLPCVIRPDFSFQYDRSGHMCTWNVLGRIPQHHGDSFNYITFAAWFYPLFGLLQIILMVGSVTLASALVVKARYVLTKHGNHQKVRKGRKRGKAPNLAEGILLSLSYLVGVSFLILTQINDYLLPQEAQIHVMTSCTEWNIFKTSAIFLTSLLNQFAIGLKNRRIRKQLLRDLRKSVIKRYSVVKRRISRSDYIVSTFRLRSDTRLSEITSQNRLSQVT
ncbi:hypothetical protein ACHWQZ_G008484 [Mnemiopsis leidyi]